MFIRARAKLMVDVNGLLVGFKDIPHAVHRFCAPAFFHNEDQTTYDLTARGSSLLLRFKGTNFAVLTAHQLGRGLQALQARDFTIGIDDPDGGKVGLTPNAVTSVTIASEGEKNLEDLQILLFEDTRNGRDLSRMFLTLDLDHTLETVSEAAIKAIFLIGFPNEYTEVEVDVSDWDDETAVAVMTMKLRWVYAYLQRAKKPDPFDTENRLVLEPHAKAPTTLLNPDGLSGGPVFFVWQDDTGQARLGLAGIVTNARRDRFAVYSAAHIRTALQQLVDLDSSKGGLT